MAILSGSSFCRIAVLGALALAPAFSAQVGVYVNADQADFFSTLTQDMTSIDFNNLVPINGWQGSFDSSGVTVAGVQFVGIGTGDYYTALIWPSNNYKDWGTGALVEGVSAVDGQPDRGLHIELPVAVTAIGFNLMTGANAGVYTTGGEVSISLSTLDTLGPLATTAWTSASGKPSPAASGLSPAWVGITSDTPFTSVDIRPLTGSILLDNLSYGSAQITTNPDDPPVNPPDVTETPEAGTMLLIGTGLFGLRYVRRAFGGGTPA